MKPSSATGTRWLGAGQDDADEPGDLEAAHLGEHVERVGRIGAIDHERAADHGDLPPPAGLVHAGASAGHLLGRRAGDGGR